MLLNLWDSHQPNNSPLLWFLCYQCDRFWQGIFQFRIQFCVNFQFKLQLAFALVPASSLVSHLSYDLWRPFIWSESSYLTEKLKTSRGNPPHLFFCWCAYRKLMTSYKTQYWKTLITLQLNTKLSSSTLAKNSIYTKMCQQQGSTQTSPLTEIRWTFSWTCYRSCIYLSQSLNLHGIRVVVEAGH